MDQKQTVYLDSAVLFQAQRDYERGDSTLRQTINSLADNTQLCLSSIHLFEIMGDPEAERVYRLAAWLDTLRFKYISPECVIQKREFKRLLIKKIGGPELPINPLGPTLFDALSEAVRQEHVPHLVKEGQNIEQYCRHCHPVRESLIQTPLTETLDTLRRMSLDRLMNPELKADPRMGKKIVYGKVCAAVENDIKLLAKDPSRCFSQEELEQLCSYDKAKGLYCSPDFSRAELVKVEKEDIVFMPFTYIFTESAFILCNRLLKPGDPNFNRSHKSDPLDHMHLVGAAYCDYFSCDFETAERIHSSRAKLGMPPPLAVKKSRPGYFSSYQALLDHLIEKGQCPLTPANTVS